jgi:EmrB/QacA subfamily drug resistance transporter
MMQLRSHMLIQSKEFCMTPRRVVVVTGAIMLSLFLASMESTVVATGMPTIVSQLGGLEYYSWVFSAYMLASTTTVPLYGKLSDLYGRKPIYAAAMIIFLIGSLLCGFSQSMVQLVAARAVQGIGAGGLLPLAFIIIGDMFTLEQRARMQGLFSSVWGVSSVVGPLLGGFLVDQVSWHWIFFINIVPGLIAGILVWQAWVDQPREGKTRPSVDYAGAFLLTAGVVVLLLGLFELGTPVGWVLLVGAVLAFALLGWVERRAPDPVLPLSLFRDRLFIIACAHGILAGWAMFGSTAYIPLFVQAVLGTSATAAGATLTPLLIAWVIASIIGSRLLLKMGYRTLAVIGMVLLTIGSFMMSRISAGSSQLSLVIGLSLMGIGMGLSIPAFLIAVQSTVERRFLGTATSTLQFSRSIGGVLGVSVMGVALAASLATNLRAAGLDPAAVSIDALLDPLAQSSANASLDTTLRVALASAIQNVFLLAFIAAAIGLVATALAPAGRIAQLVARRAQSHEEPVKQPVTIE